MKKSKKMISLVLAIAMVLLVPVSVVSAAPKGYGFRYAGVTVYVHGKASGLIDKMGEPNKKSKSKSCAYDGEDIKYVYDDFTLVTYTEKKGGTEYVQSIKFTSKKAKTKEGIKIGSKEKTMKKKTKITKTLALALTLGLLCSGLAGCGQAQSVETVSEDLAAESVQPTETVESTETVAEGTEATAENAETADGTLVRVASLKGPTSLGLLFLMNKADKGETANTYEFQMATGADEILPLMVKGDLDIALVPANVASVLYHKTQGGVEVIDINTLGVLYMVSGEDGLTNLTDLKGKTIYLTGKGTTPDYVLQYLLTANGMSADDVILEYKSEATEVASVLAEDPTAIGLLPQPFVTAACMQNDALKVIFDLNEEWNKVQGEDGSSMVTGVTVVRKEFLEENEEAVKSFMEDHKASAEDINADPATGAALAVEAQIVAKEPIAQKAIPNCNITYIDKAEMKQALSGYLDVLFHQDSLSIGGGLPESDFYYDAE